MRKQTKFIDGDNFIALEYDPDETQESDIDYWIMIGQGEQSEPALFGMNGEDAILLANSILEMVKENSGGNHGGTQGN